LVFVYGTLRRGRLNHHHLESGPPKVFFLGRAETVDRFPFVIGTQFRVPYLLDRKGEGKYVTGEIYAVDDEILERLDILEGVPNYYNRIEIEVSVLPEEVPFGSDRSLFHHISLASGKTITVNCYFRIRYDSELANLPAISDYTDEYAREYVPRHLRGTGTSMLQMQRTFNQKESDAAAEASQHLQVSRRTRVA